MKNFVLLVVLIISANTFGSGSLSYLKSQQFVTKHIATPSNPASGHNKLYSKSDDKLYFLTSAGAESNFLLSPVGLAGSDVTGTLPTTKGGTGIASYTTGDLLYSSASNVLSVLAAGTNGYVLTMTAGVPVWAASAAGASSVGTINSQTKSANGAVISGSSLVMQEADATNNGLVSTGAQTLAGAKTFSSAPNLSSLTASLPLKLDASKNVTAATIDLTSAEVTGALVATKGGTAQSTYTTGDILYASASNTLSKLPIGSTGKVLTVTAGAPAWETAAAGGAKTYCAITDASGNISLETEPWVTGTCTFAAGYNTCELDFSFTQKPVCYANQLSSTSGETTYRDDLSDTNTVVIQTFNSSGTTTARAHSFCCTGPR